ncbi:alpha/beta hydrolase fold domain-containing protein [Phthorimaea operculella]|nr:alpha/beta hydrolase fold domain-containing protein [Phthorimaea operculella]
MWKAFRYELLFAAVALLHVSSSQLLNINSLSDVLGLNIDILNVVTDVLETAPSLVNIIAEQATTDFLQQYQAGENNDEKNLPIDQLAARYGQKLQRVTVQTQDGYKLALYRIQGNGDPVLLVHGLTNSAVDWFTVGKENSLPILLAEQGYDVWLISCRGSTTESQGHTSYSLPGDADQYWDFSWDEMGLYDLPATIDYILQATGKSQVKYVGFSQGTTSFYVMASLKPEYGEKVSVMVSLAPIAWVSNTKSPLLRILGPLLSQYSGVIRNVVGFNEFDANNPLIKLLTNGVCGTSMLAPVVCATTEFAVFGFNYAQVNATQAPVISGHAPSSVSSKQIFHYAQVYDSGRFRRYDLGAAQNKATYGSEAPPDYPVEKITTPVALFYTDTNDWVSVDKDVATLRSKLPNVVDFYKIPYPTWAHFDHIWAKDLKKLSYDRILQLFQKY